MASLLGLDIGDVRIGVAIADTKAPFAAPLKTLEASPNLASEFAQLLHTHKVERVIIGYPRNMNGEATDQTARVEQIAGLLNIPGTIQTIWQDESLTSVKAEEELKKRGKPHDKGAIDSLAATYILDDYINTAYRVQKSTAIESVASKPSIDKKTKSKKHNSKSSNKSKKKTKKGALKLIVLLALGLMVAALVCLVAWYVYSISPRTSDDVYKVVKIKEGDTTKIIATKLQNDKVIKSSQAFTIYVRLNGINNLQAGSYRLSSSDSTSEIATTIADGKVTTTDVLISPGLRLDQITALLVKDGFTEDDIDKALIAVRDHPLLNNYPETKKLEGYLYPNTYQIDPDTSAEQLFRSVLGSFNNSITPEIRQGLKDQGLTLEQGIILASIVQKEVSDSKVQKTVAQVFIKRLNDGTVLGSDVTYKYAAAQFDTPDNPSSDSPYNTRKFLGLPPTPIANFNISALKAVANPTDTTYNYFVAGDDGTTHFATTLDEHEANVAKYCIKGCQ